ncbi:nucleotide sugar dehydrogenase [Candidatus Dependentiae bacterium]|nr:nucleotide sugar dehydrogenase [Candidatus Dependentiae bacterium]
MKTVSVLGLGYIGLPTGIVLANSGYKVFGFDIDLKKIKSINSGDPLILEKSIKEKLANVLQNHTFIASDKLQPADYFIISVPTPFIKDTNNLSEKIADLSYVFDAAKKIALVLKKGDLVILESTVPVGTTIKIAKFLEKESGLILSKDFFVSHCPERVLPGRIFEELVSNDRVVGGVCDKSCSLAKEFYSKFVKGEIYISDDKTAEMVKLVENSYRDLNIAFANEISFMAKSVGINPFKVIDIANKHPRVNILNPGCGVGGHCIAVDPWFLIQTFPKSSQTLRMARIINDSKPYYVIDKVLNELKSLNKIEKPKVLALGLTFKADVDDLRGSPALKVAKELNTKKEQLELAVIEPNIKDEILRDFNFKYFKNLSSAIFWADVILVLIGHKNFFELNDFDLKDKLIIDECGLLYKIKNEQKNISIDDNIEKYLNL